MSQDGRFLSALAEVLHISPERLRDGIYVLSTLQPHLDSLYKRFLYDVLFDVDPAQHLLRAAQDAITSILSSMLRRTCSVITFWDRDKIYFMLPQDAVQRLQQLTEKGPREHLLCERAVAYSGEKLAQTSLVLLGETKPNRIFGTQDDTDIQQWLESLRKEIHVLPEILEYGDVEDKLRLQCYKILRILTQLYRTYRVGLSYYEECQVRLGHIIDSADRNQFEYSQQLVQLFIQECNKLISALTPKSA